MMDDQVLSADPDDPRAQEIMNAAIPVIHLVHTLTNGRAKLACDTLLTAYIDVAIAAIGVEAARHALTFAAANLEKVAAMIAMAENQPVGRA